MPLRSSTCDALYCATVSRNGIISILRLWQISGRNLSYRCAKGKRVARPYDSNFRSSARVNTLPANHTYPRKCLLFARGLQSVRAPLASQSIHRQTKTGAQRSDRKPRTSPNVLDRLLRLQVVDVKRRLLWWRSEPTLDALLHSGHQDAVAEPLPTLLGVVDSHDRPATSRRTSRVKDLAFRQALSARDAPPRLTPRTAPSYHQGSDAQSRTPFPFSFQVIAAASRGP